MYAEAEAVESISPTPPEKGGVGDTICNRGSKVLEFGGWWKNMWRGRALILALAQSAQRWALKLVEWRF